MSYYNDGYASDIIPIVPQGTNSTMFTMCCSVAICDDQPNCPHCGRPVIGHNADNNNERRNIRWKNATKYWESHK
jgi:hypothetical protein